MSPQQLDFEETFKLLTGNGPFPWQTALYNRFVADRRDNIPASCNLPTGLGKTSVIAVWLIALAHGANVPRRLVYVVNRRTVVDQTTDEVEKYRERLNGLADPSPLKDKLGSLALSTLRGQFADNRKWSEDPSRPAVICGTVDMIGSRLLFSGYGIGFKQKPLHAGFLGQDALLVHDEAHLEPAFQSLITAIEKEQNRCGDFRPVRVMELTATSRGGSDAFGLTDEDMVDSTVRQRVTAQKTLHLHESTDKKKLAEQISELALRFKDSGRAVLVFVRTVEDVMKVRDKLPKGTVETLTGTMRGKERDELVGNQTFARFLPNAASGEKTVYLVCTSAGEVGVNISADHLVCDLSTFDSMAQRFGRVNRFGEHNFTEIHVVHPAEFEDDEYDQRCGKTLNLLRRLNGSASPASLGELPATERQAAFAPPPTILPVTDILFDAWALTTIRDKLPGRPKVEPFLHGLSDWEPPETHVAWREEVERLQPKYQDAEEDKEREGEDRKAIAKQAGELLDAYPLKPHELLREPSYRAFKHFEAMAKRCPNAPVWLLDDDGNVQVLTVGELADKDDKKRIEGMTVLLPPTAGGLESGMLNGSTPAPQPADLDVADKYFAPDGHKQLRVRVWDEEDKLASGMRLVREVSLPTNGDDEVEPKVWFWFSRENEGEKSAPKPVEWSVHVDDVVTRTRAIVANLPLPEEIKKAIVVAAQCHDHGKRRKLFQTVLGNFRFPTLVLAKSGAKSGGKVIEKYRHEFGSLLDSRDEKDFQELADELKELVLHVIASHHGRARPHFPSEEVFDPDCSDTAAGTVAACVPRRFARLQRKYGRWGLAYLESLLRAADWAASTSPSKYLGDEK
ncbi:type I-U CRISPR-associated helicase/endonuclease Cas3 [Fimbriiglobus ruber]|uniref:CRISPR-associated helicase Cas3 n=1 Tax=Fimbriiglobus ruber TaxID=1908690 RepID=A0A225D6T8_9BACT|nr:type I-U CRISPR-associated helicase/endonuclease Cas3 [Fimbriiglobus ruber]OWK37310.1 CRISPR-associated helicase Cas3 [Fimbriiglobus ruber]